MTSTLVLVLVVGYRDGWLGLDTRHGIMVGYRKSSGSRRSMMEPTGGIRIRGISSTGSLLGGSRVHGVSVRRGPDHRLSMPGVVDRNG